MDDKIKYNFPLLIYDEECPLCVRFKQSLERVSLEQKVSFVSLYRDDLYENFPMLNREACYATIHLLLSENEVLMGEHAIEYLINLNPQVQKFSWLIESKMGQKALSIFYNSVNNYRETLRNRCPSCRNKA